MRQEHDPLKVSNRGRVARQREIKNEIVDLEGQILNQVFSLMLKYRKKSELYLDLLGVPFSKICLFTG